MKFFLKVSVYSIMFVGITSCGSSSEELEDEVSDLTEESYEESSDEDTQDFSSIASAEDAMDEYKSLLEEYSDLVKDGDTQAASELKSKLDDLKMFAESEFGMDELKALTELSKLAIQLEAGKMVDLSKAFNAYDKSLEVLKNIPMDAESEKALKDAKDAMKGLEGLGGF